MAVRTPLFNNSGNIQEMSSSQITSLKNYFRYQFFLSNPVDLQYVASGGNIGTIDDTRLQAGAHSTSASAFPSEGTTAEPSTVTVNHAKINQVLKTTPTLTSDSGKLYPCYLDSSNNIQAMNLQDMKDTFVHPVIDELASTDNTTLQAGTFFISTSSSAADSNKQVVSSNTIFSDTRADTSAYTSGSIPETQDQPTTLTNYYLQRINGTNTSFTSPVFIRSDDQIQIYPTATFQSLLQEWIRYTAASSSDGYAISYNINGTGTNRGSGIIDQRLNGSGNYQTRFVNANDYRAQEFPNGTLTTINTYFLKINKS